MKTKIIWKILSAFIALITIAVFILNFIVGSKLQIFLEHEISNRLRTNTILLGEIISKDFNSLKPESLQLKIAALARSLDTRITIISATGDILADSEKGQEIGENHLYQIEIQRSINTGIGESKRYSDTLQMNMIYVAVPIHNNASISGFVRLAIPLNTVKNRLRTIYQIINISGIVAIVFVFIIGFFISRAIVKPVQEMINIAELISEGDLSIRVKTIRNDELGILATSLNKMADEMQNKIKNLDSLYKAKTDFVANASHELQTPLTSIIGYIEILEDGEISQPDNALRFFKNIKKNSLNMSNIVRDLLFLSEIEQTNNQQFSQRCNLEIIINDVIQSSMPKLKKKNQKILFKVFGKKKKIPGDKHKLEQVFVNLIDNASKYTPENGEIEIILQSEKTKITIEIIDNGIGISETHLDRIFERFYRVDKARSRKSGGTGLGLAIVKHIVLLHKGEIKVSSIIDKGTTFQITFFKNR